MIKLVTRIEDANCITHSGTMHADEVFATAFLELYLKNIKLIRVTEVDPNQYKDKYIYDIGRGKFDHHQPEARRRENEIKYSSFGLLWLEYGKDFLTKEKIKMVDEVFERIDKEFIEAIDAIDNGVFPKIEAPYKVKTLSDVISLFNPSYQGFQDEKEQFLKAVAIAKAIFQEEIKSANGKEVARSCILEQLKNYSHHTLILKEYMPYEETILTEDTAKDIYFVIYPSNRGGYAIKTVRKSVEDSTARVKFPLEWAGLEKEELAEKTGVPGALFCHVERFIVTCETLEDAIKIVEKVLQLEVVNTN